MVTKELVMIPKGIETRPYTVEPYVMGYWDETSRSWKLNDMFSQYLVGLMRDFGWGDVDNGDFPDLEITVE